MNIIILSEDRVGQGHHKAALALQEAFGRLYPDYRVRVQCGMRLIHPLMEKAIVSAYFQLIRRIPSMWGFLYGTAKTSPFLQKYGFALALTSWLKQERPDVILCTHPACIPPLGFLKKKSNHSFRLAFIATDYSLHPFAVNQNVDIYFVGHKTAKLQLEREYAIPAERVHASGIPLTDAFGKAFKATLAQNRLHENKFRVLMMGGGDGFGRLDVWFRQLLPYIKQLQVTVICGRNKQLYNRLKPFEKQFPSVRIHGFVRDIPDHLRDAEVVITKPGGLSITEALQYGKPLLLLPPIPGQEEANLEFVKRNELGLPLRKPEELPERLFQLRDNRLHWQKRLDSWRETGLSGSAADYIVHTVLT